MGPWVAYNWRTAGSDAFGSIQKQLERAVRQVS